MPPAKSAPSPTTQRLGSLRAALAEAGLDAVYLRNLVNIRYLTGFRGTFAHLIVDRDKALFVTDGRYAEIAEGVVRDAKIEILPLRDADAFFRALFRREAYRSLGFEGTLTVDEHAVLRRVTRGAGTHLEREPGLVGRLRAVKDKGEVRLIRKAARIADRMMEEAFAAARKGTPERDIVRIIRRTAEDLGAEGVSFDPIVAGGPNASRPHHKPATRRLRAGDMITIDLGAIVDGYCSDLTRNPALGRASKRFEQIYSVCLEAQKAALAACRNGARGSDVDAVAREIIATAGFGEYFNHGTGHGVGLEIHEAPRLSAASKDVLREGNVVTVEPGIYIPGFGGVRIEDLVLVTADKPRILSRAPKTLTVLPA